MSASKLWQAGAASTDAVIEHYTVGDDHQLDQQLLPYDLMASRAHAAMLHHMDILSLEEWKKTQDGLDAIHQLWKTGQFVIRPDQEDGHTAIEQYLTAHYGEVGQKIHTGRSRNDQALVMLRLYMKDHLLSAAILIEAVAEAARARADATDDIPMPGYTHMQPAMPTTVGRWLRGYADGWADAALLARRTLPLIDQNPLGSASGFGIEPLPLDRAFTTEMLGFERTQESVHYCGLSRGWMEVICLQALQPAMMLAGRFAQDMLLFTSAAYNFFALPERFTTGSSIMPQKRNYDLFELMRARVRRLEACVQEIHGIVGSLPGGYQRDLQRTKPCLMEGMQVVEESMQVLQRVLPEITVHPNHLNAAMTPDIYRTDAVYQLVREGVPFREAYQRVKKEGRQGNGPA